ncbi:MAG: hypothetical protein WCO98_16355, partial [bacterium]
NEYTAPDPQIGELEKAGIKNLDEKVLLVYILISNSLDNNAGTNFINLSDSHEVVTLLVFIIFGFITGTVISHYAEIELHNSMN